MIAHKTYLLNIYDDSNAPEPCKLMEVATSSKSKMFNKRLKNNGHVDDRR